MILETKLFRDLNISDEIKSAICDMKFEEMTPIQAKSIEPIMSGKDVIAQAPTGTGKTCAFGIPVIENIDVNCDKVQALILCPTRELANQIANELRSLCKYKANVRTLSVYGGQPMDRQIMALKKKPQIIIGTPGRVMDHLRRRTLKLDDLRMLVLDEADEMLNMGFREDIDTILQSAPNEKQFILFSATLPKAIQDIASEYQKDAERISVVKKTVTVDTIKQYYIDVNERYKIEVLSRMMEVTAFKLGVVFCNTKRGVDEVCEALQHRGFSAEALHGDMKQLQRDSVMAKFRKGLVNILVATDVAARGIDVDDIDVVFNYDVPTDEEYYVHRIGRTGRAMRQGLSYTLCTPKDRSKLRFIQNYTKSKIEQAEIPTIEVIKDQQATKLVEIIKDEMGTKMPKRYKECLDRLIEEGYEQEQMIEALFKLVMKNQTMSADDRIKLEDLQPSRNTGQVGDHVRLFINLGKKDKLKDVDLIKMVTKETSTPRNGVRRIDIMEKFSFFEVPNGCEDEILGVLTKQKYKGRKINIEVAQRKGGSSRKGR